MLGRRRHLLVLIALCLLAGAGRAEIRPALTREALSGRRFRFSWKTANGAGHNGVARLRADGTIRGIPSPNESFWRIDKQGRLLFLHRDGRVSTLFTDGVLADGLWRLEGAFQFNPRVTHVLEEIPLLAPAPDLARALNEAIRPYSRQSIVWLAVGGEHRYRLRAGQERCIRIESIALRRDRVIGRAREASVTLTIDKAQHVLLCRPYVMPTVIDGLRIQVDTVTGWDNMPRGEPRRAQLSLWDARDPIVDPKAFVFPVEGYDLFSHGTQCFNEVVHLGATDGGPRGPNFYHDYGFDLAGYEGKHRILSCAAGEVVKLWKGNGVVVRADNGSIWSHAHLDSFAPGLRVGSRVRAGQWIGMLGRKGPSGNFSHLHVGSYLSTEDMNGSHSNRNLNLYPWLVWAAHSANPRPLYAVARPHRLALTGETVTLDGSQSFSFGSRIASFRWQLGDGKDRRTAVTKVSFSRPGTYCLPLWVEDDRGNRDVDFCTVRVFSAERPERVMPTVFMSHQPAQGVAVGQPVSFRCWLQGAPQRPLRLAFNDGSVLEAYKPMSEATHTFRTGGVHVVTAEAVVDGVPIQQCQKVRVCER